MTPNSVEPTEAALLKMLEMQWQDHFQTRVQTWKSLEIATPMIVALVALDWGLKNALATFMLRMHFIIFLFALAYFGVRVRDLSGV